MNWPTFIDAATKYGRQESNRKNGRFAIWPWIFVVAIIVFLVMMSDASFTGDPRITRFQQGGMQP
jgi:hypothetical protein